MSQFGKTKLVKKMHFDDSAKEKLFSGINKIADAVGSTLGASGKTVIIENDYGDPHITKDGVTVANSILLQDPLENLAVSMMKQAAQKTASVAGDGTTTSIVLTKAIIDSYYKLKGNDFSFRDIKSGINKFAKEVIKHITSKAVPVDSKMLHDVSIISANNDTELGGMIAGAFESAGDNGIVTMETSPNNDTYIENVNGTKIGSTCKTPHFLY